MPCLRIETNVAKSSFDADEFSAELTAAVAKTLGKPVNYVMVVMVPDVHLVFMKCYSSVIMSTLTEKSQCFLHIITSFRLVIYIEIVFKILFIQF